MSPVGQWLISDLQILREMDSKNQTETLAYAGVLARVKTTAFFLIAGNY
jgi:hypothetical protein